MSQSEINVVVVDDDESFARSLERLFRASGLLVRTCPSAEAYLAEPTRSHPDCLVLDIHLGGMSGLELQFKLRERGDFTPVIFVTAHDAPEAREEAKRGGCSDYFQKPVAGKKIIEAVRKALSQSNGDSGNRAACWSD